MYDNSSEGKNVKKWETYVNFMAKFRQGLKNNWKYISIKRPNRLVTNVLALLYQMGACSYMYNNINEKQYCNVVFRYKNNENVVSSIVTYARPGNHYSLTKKDLWRDHLLRDRRAHFVLSTPMGLRVVCPVDSQSLKSIKGGVLLFKIRFK